MKIHPRSIILLAISAFGGSVTGRTLLQKRLYFIDELLQKQFGDSAGFSHNSHFYGPYSPTVSDELTVLVASGFLQQFEEPFGYSNRGFEVKRHHYQLTDAGRNAVERLKQEHGDDSAKVDALCDQLKALGSVDYVKMSIAAKTHFMLKRRNAPMSAEAAVEEAKKFSWKVSTPEVADSFSLLEKLGLAKVVTHS